MKKKFAIIFMFAVLSICIYGMEPHTGPGNPFSEPSRNWCYAKNSLFVQAPATLGYYSLYPLGVTLALPAAIQARRDVVCFLGAHTFSYWGYLSVGAPFYLLETVFRDGPVYLYKSIFNDEEKSAAKKEQVSCMGEKDCQL